VSKLVFLKIGEGSFDQGFPVTLQIGNERTDFVEQQFAYQVTAEVTGKLPANPELLQLHQQWQSIYRNLGLRSRLHAPKVQITNVSITQDCHQAAQALSDRLNAWLRSESFRPLREKWLEQLSLQDCIRVILQSDHPVIQRLPWQLWDVLERYTQAELALSLPRYERIARPVLSTSRVRILAILGNSQGIDLQSDRAFLEHLPDAEVCFLVEPQRQMLNDQLWQQSWDILFFAGHSTSEADNSSGAIRINQTDRLTIEQLKYGLKQAVAQGLSLAIFNSCDGLGLARNLAELQIPQMVVMREPVPDRVAQLFLKSFLSRFAQGQSLYHAVRQAREQLQGLEHQFPCATWLPVICQNPAELPATWQQLQAPPAGELTPKLHPPKLHRTRSRPRYTDISALTGWLRAASLRIGLGLLVALGVVGLRSIGSMQAAELMAFDQLVRLQPSEPADERMVVVTIDAQERQLYGADHPDLGWISLSDRTLNQLLQQLEPAEPRLIGIDLYRDFAVAADQPGLVSQLQQNPKLLTVCKARFLGGDSIAPPPDVPIDRVGFSDFVVDDDQMLRRHLLRMTPDLIDPGIPCTSPQSFSLQLAWRYLHPNKPVDRTIRFGNSSLPLLQPSSGGYWRADTQGQQILLNYRRSSRPASQVSLTQVLSGQVNPEILRDRIVLIGVIDPSTGDTWQTPIDRQMPGVMVQAHMVSQLLSAELEQRPLLWTWSDAAEGLWIGCWSIVGSGLGWAFRRVTRLGLAIVISTGLLSSLCWGMMVLVGGWMPLIPSLLGLLLSSSTIGLFQLPTRWVRSSPRRLP
jgi:CHASE2 domain-containing sensor protein